MASAEKPDRHFVTEFAGEVCVTAPTEAEAQEKALLWGMRRFTESLTVTPGAAAVHPCEPGQFAVPLTGTVNFMGPSRAAVEEKVRDLLETVRREGPSLGVTMGPFQIVPRADEDAEDAGGDPLL